MQGFLLNDIHQGIKIMQTQINSKYGLQKIGSYLFNFGALTGVATLTFGLISCGGGGGDGGGVSNAPGSTASAISRMTTIAVASSPKAWGTLASSSPQALSIFGTNFGSGVSNVTVTIATPGGGTVNYSASSVTPTKIIANVTILSVPADRYVTVTVRTAANGSVSGILGVAQNYKTIANIQTIFDASCGGCHAGNASLAGGLDLRTTDVTSSTLIGEASTTCGSATKKRVTAGDPRSANNTLITVLRAKTTNVPIYCEMPKSGEPLTTEINDIIDWIALGAI